MLTSFFWRRYTLARTPYEHVHRTKVYFVNLLLTHTYFMYFYLHCTGFAGECLSFKIVLFSIVIRLRFAHWAALFLIKCANYTRLAHKRLAHIIHTCARIFALQIEMSAIQCSTRTQGLAHTLLNSIYALILLFCMPLCNALYATAQIHLMCVWAMVAGGISYYTAFVQQNSFSAAFLLLLSALGIVPFFSFCCREKWA